MAEQDRIRIRSISLLRASQTTVGIRTPGGLVKTQIVQPCPSISDSVGL